LIAVDTSALMAIAAKESEAAACLSAIAGDPEVLISAGTIAEALIVAGRRGISQEMAELFASYEFIIVDVTEASARRIAAAYARWGRGVHIAALNFGDCFAYEAAKQHNCPLLFVGKGFAKTDIRSALAR
jgi:ribonuclease VapC